MANNDDFNTSQSSGQGNVAPALAMLAGFLSQRRTNPNTGGPQFPLVPGLLAGEVLRQQSKGAAAQQQFDNMIKLGGFQNQQFGQQMAKAQFDQSAQQQLFSQAQGQFGVAPIRIQAPPGVTLMGQSGRVIPTSPTGVGFTAPDTQTMKERGARQGIEESEKKNRIFTSDPEVAGRAMTLRQQFEQLPEVQDFKIVLSNVRSMDSLLKSSKSGNLNSRVALDQSLINLFNKIQDPPSTIRESEYARTGQSASVINRIIGSVEKLSAGGVELTDLDRDDLVTAAKIITDERGNLFNESIERFKGFSEVLGVPESIVTSGFKPHKKYFENVQQSNKPLKKGQGGQLSSGNKFKVV